MVYIPPHFIAEWREARKASIFSSAGWWLNRWPALGWAETLLKVIAWTYAPYVALVPPAPGAPSVFLTAPAEAAGAAATTTAAAGGADAGTAAVAAAAAAAAAGATTAAAATLPASPRAVVAALAGAPGFAGDAAFALQTGVMAAAAALILAAIIDRLVYREVISAIFVVPNSWAHVVVVASMVRGGRGGVDAAALRGFCWWMLAGDVIKLVFFAVHDFDIIAVAKYVRAVGAVVFFGAGKGVGRRGTGGGTGPGHRGLVVERLVAAWPGRGRGRWARRRVRRAVYATRCWGMRPGRTPSPIRGRLVVLLPWPRPGCLCLPSLTRIPLSMLCVSFPRLPVPSCRCWAWRHPPPAPLSLSTPLPPHRYCTSSSFRLRSRMGWCCCSNTG